MCSRLTVPLYNLLYKCQLFSGMALNAKLSSPPRIGVTISGPAERQP
jgi:hypothetical protein